MLAISGPSVKEDGQSELFDVVCRLLQTHGLQVFLSLGHDELPLVLLVGEGLLEHVDGEQSQVDRSLVSVGRQLGLLDSRVNSRIVEQAVFKTGRDFGACRLLPSAVSGLACDDLGERRLNCGGYHLR